MWNGRVEISAQPGHSRTATRNAASSLTPPGANPTSAIAVLQPGHVRTTTACLQCDKVRAGSGDTRPEREDLFRYDDTQERICGDAWDLLCAGTRRRARSADRRSAKTSAGETSCGCPGCTTVQSGPVLAEAVAESLEHAAAARTFCRRQKRPRLVSESLAGGGHRRDWRRRQPAANRLLHPRTRAHRTRSSRERGQFVWRTWLSSALAGRVADRNRRSAGQRLGWRNRSAGRHRQVLARWKVPLGFRAPTAERRSDTQREQPAD